MPAGEADQKPCSEKWFHNRVARALLAIRHGLKSVRYALPENAHVLDELAEILIHPLKLGIFRPESFVLSLKLRKVAARDGKLNLKN